MNRMKINLAVPGIGGLAGGQRVCAQYAGYLLDQGHEVTLVVRRPPRIPQRFDVLRRLLGRIPPYPPLPAEWGHYTGLDLRVAHLDENRPLVPDQVPDADIIISTWWTTSEWVHGLPASKGRHVHFVQDYEVFDPQLKHRVEAVYAQDNIKIVVAGWLQKQLLAEAGKPSLLVLNGVDIDKFHPDPHQHRDAEVRVGFLYSNHPRKNCALAVEALALAKSKRPELKAIVFGVQPRPQSLPDWVTYEQQPRQDRIVQIYQSCDLWLFTSKTEGFGLPLLEAMACGIPVLATPAGAAPDLVNGHNGWLTSGDPVEYADQMLAFLDQPSEDLRQASLAARQTAGVHDLRQAASRFEKILLDLLTDCPESASRATHTCGVA